MTWEQCDSTLEEDFSVISLHTRLYQFFRKQSLLAGNFSCVKNNVSSEIHLNFQNFKIFRWLKETQEIK